MASRLYSIVYRARTMFDIPCPPKLIIYIQPGEIFFGGKVRVSDAGAEDLTTGYLWWASFRPCPPKIQFFQIFKVLL